MCQCMIVLIEKCKFGCTLIVFNEINNLKTPKTTTAAFSVYLLIYKVGEVRNELFLDKKCNGISLVGSMSFVEACFFR